MFKKSGIMASLVIGASLVALPAVSEAAALTITNNTTSPMTSIINGFICSGDIPVHGTTPPGQSDIIPAEMVDQMCGMAKEACTAVIFAGPHCRDGGTEIGTVVLSVNSGVVAYSTHAGSPYTVNTSPGSFTITVG